jgi:hypothetical protein
LAAASGCAALKNLGKTKQNTWLEQYCLGFMETGKIAHRMAKNIDENMVVFGIQQKLKNVAFKYPDMVPLLAKYLEREINLSNKLLANNIRFEV